MFKKVLPYSNLTFIPVIFIFLVPLMASFKVDKNLMDQLDSYDIKFYHFDLEVSNTTSAISGMAEIHAQWLVNPIDTLVLQLSTSMIVDSVLINNQALPFFHADQLLKVPVNLPANPNIIIQVYYGGTPTGSFFKGVHNKYSSIYDRSVTWTFSQPFYAYKWFPCKEDHSDKIDSVRMVLRTDSTITAVSSGRLFEKTPLDSGKVMFDWRTKYAISYDMIFFAVSDYILYDYYIQPQGYEDSILISNYVYSQEYLDDYKDRLDSVGLFVEYYSEIYGLYPFADECYGLVVVPGVPCMTENNTLVIMPEELDFGFTHTFIDGNCHELAHQWFGDYVACHSYEDIWLSEGFGMYSGYLGEQRFGNLGEDEKWMDKTLAQAFGPQCGSVHVPENKLLNASRIFDWKLTYCKGAMLVHMIRYELQDDELFFTVLKNYIEDFANGTSYLEDFKSVLEEATGMDFTTFFNQWYYGEGYPLLDINWEQEDGLLNIYSSQGTTCDTTPLFQFTMDYQLVFAAGDTIIRLYQDDTLNEYSFPIEQTVLEIIPDPERWILVKSNIGYVGIEERSALMEFELFPNPASDVVRLRYRMQDPSTTIGRQRLTDGKALGTGSGYRLPALPTGRQAGQAGMIEVFEISGKKVLSKAFKGVLTDLDVSELPSGLYFIRFTAGNQATTQKLIVY